MQFKDEEKTLSDESSSFHKKEDLTFQETEKPVCIPDEAAKPLPSEEAGSDALTLDIDGMDQLSRPPTEKKKPMPCMQILDIPMAMLKETAGTSLSEFLCQIIDIP